MTHPTRKSPVHVADLRGYGRLAVDATIGLANLVETMHHNILRRRLGSRRAGWRHLGLYINPFVDRAWSAVASAVLAKLVPLFGSGLPQEAVLSTERRAATTATQRQPSRFRCSSGARASARIEARLLSAAIPGNRKVSARAWPGMNDLLGGGARPRSRRSARCNQASRRFTCITTAACVRPTAVCRSARGVVAGVARYSRRTRDPRP